MTITLSGANTVVRLNDHTNYRFRASNQPSIGRYLRTGTYTEETDSFVIDVVGSGINQNLKNLFLLQNSVQSWKETGIDPVQVLYSGENGKEYYTLVTNLDVRIPSTYYDYDTLQGVIGVELDVTRKGAYISKTKETLSSGVRAFYNTVGLTPGYWPVMVCNSITFSGADTTILNGFQRLPTPSPLSIVISGMPLTSGTGSAIPEGYLFTAGRLNYTAYPTTTYSGSFDPDWATIRYTNLSALRTLSSGIYENYQDLQRSNRNTNNPLTASTNVVRTSFGDGSNDLKTKNICNLNNNSLVASIIPGLRLHEKVHIYASLRNTAPVDWSATFVGSSTASGINVNPEIYSWQQLSDRTICIVSGETDPVVRYLGTITRPQNMALSALGVVFQPSRDFAAERNVPLASGSLLFQNFYLVADTPETSVIKMNRTPMRVTGAAQGSFIVVDPGFLENQPAVYATSVVGNSVSGVMNDRVFATPIEYRGNMPYASSDIIFVAYSATSNGSWEVTESAANEITARYQLYVERPEATTLPGVS